MARATYTPPAPHHKPVDGLGRGALLSRTSLIVAARHPRQAPARREERTIRRFSTTLRVRYAETDRMGVVYHAHYLVWCEIGRTELLRELGSSYARLEADGLLLAVADARIRYHGAARYDDTIRIDSWLERVRSRTVEFGYEIVRVEPGPSERLATASTRLVALSDDRRPRALPSHVTELLRQAS